MYFGESNGPAYEPPADMDFISIPHNHTKPSQSSSVSQAVFFSFTGISLSLIILLCSETFYWLWPRNHAASLLLPPTSGRSPQAQVSSSAFIVKDGVRSFLLLIHSTFQAELIHLTGGNGFWVFHIKHGKKLGDKCSGINITFHNFYVRCIGIVLSNSIECKKKIKKILNWIWLHKIVNQIKQSLKCLQAEEKSSAVIFEFCGAAAFQFDVIL